MSRAVLPKTVGRAKGPCRMRLESLNFASGLSVNVGVLVMLIKPLVNSCEVRPGSMYSRER